MGNDRREDGLEVKLQIVDGKVESFVTEGNARNLRVFG